MAASIPEIVTGPMMLYKAAVGTVEPDIDIDLASLPAAWEPIGHVPAARQTTDGVTVEEEVEYQPFKSAAHIQEIDVWRSAQKAMVKVAGLADMRAAHLALLFDKTPSVTDPGSGQVGETVVDLARTSRVTFYALYASGMSAIDNARRAAWWFPKVCVVSPFSAQFHFEGPATPAIELTAFYDVTLTSGGYGNFRQWDAAAT